MHTALVLLPIYFWSSGGLQVSHYLLAVYSLFYFVNHGTQVQKEDIFLAIIFVIVLTRESFALANGASVDTLLPAAHVLYCAVIFNVLRRTFRRADGIAWVGTSLAIAGLLATAGVLGFGYGGDADGYGDRAIGTFNNPNQLGYFAVCLFSVGAALRLWGKASSILFSALTVMALFLAVASLSKAAMVSLGVAAGFAVFALVRDRRWLIFASVAVVMVVAVGVTLYAQGSFDHYAFVQRLQGIGTQGDDSLAARGYIVWFKDGVTDLFFGLGSTGSTEAIFGGHEVHSTIASFFVGYGLLGGLSFLSLIIMWIRRVWATLGIEGLVLVCMPVMTYGLTHNGSRFTVFWILLAMSFAVSKNALVSGDTSETLRTERLS